MIPLPYDGIPIVLGLVPLVFSLLIFALPLARMLLRPLKVKAVTQENGRRAVLREVLTRTSGGQRVPEAALENAWMNATGSRPDPEVLTRVVVDLGGDVDLEANEKDGRPAVRYRFVDLETEARALEAEREVAPDAEAQVGRVIFGSDRRDN